MVLTALILILSVLVFVWNARRRGISEKGDAFDLPTTHVMKGFAALIVVMVHFPAQYTNPLQDAAGSFAYVAVTFFFFVSAYGMEYSCEHRPGYLRQFWKNRLTGLLIPMILVNVAEAILCYVSPDYGQPLKALVALNGYVKILLEYCLAFYLLKMASKYFSLSGKMVDFILILLVAGSSLYLYFAGYGGRLNVWPYERIGLVWGLLAYRYRQPILGLLKKYNLGIIVVGAVISGILGLAYLKFKQEYFLGEYLLKIVLGLTLLTFLFSLATRWRIGNPVARLLGDISYEVYLSHGLCMGIVAYLLPSVTSGGMVALTFVIVIPLSWVVCLISKAVIRRLKGNLRLRRT